MEGEGSCKRGQTVANDVQVKAMAPDSTSHTIDINKEPDQYLNWHECCIYRVPINLREVNKEAYTPRLISIGPFHHGGEDLEPMQQQKQRTSFWKPEKSDSSRRMDSKGFRQMYKNDYILTQPWLTKGIHRDLLLLENQLPIFVLNKLYEITPDVNQRPKHECFHDLALEYFAFYDVNYQQPLDQNHRSSIHFPDLVRFFYLPKGLDTWVPSPGFHRTVTWLRQSGVSFEGVLKKHLLAIRFNKIPVLDWFLCFGCIPRFTYVKARLQIPQLKLDHDTEYVLRNLIAFEQCHYPLQPYICSYVSLIDSLVHSKDDVELLVEKEVLVHELGSEEEVATLINGLCKHVVANSTCYGKVINELKAHHRSCWNRTMAPLRLVYFRNLWLAASTVVGIGLLFVTIIKVYIDFLFD